MKFIRGEETSKRAGRTQQFPLLLEHSMSGHVKRGACASVLMLFASMSAVAQLIDQTRIEPSVVGGGIAKSLEEQIDAGFGDAYTFGTSSYIIKRDPARSIRRGRQLFQRKFTAGQGLGPRVNFESIGNIVEHGALGAGLSDSCSACHGRPRGSAGFGGVVATRPDSRDAPHLFGLGLAEMLADEITQDLRAIRDEAIESAVGSPLLPTPIEDDEPADVIVSATMDFVQNPFEGLAQFLGILLGGGQDRDNEPPPNEPGLVRAKLESKGISYGYIVARRDGSVDTSQVEGVNADLRVRPFFADGRTISIREFIIGAFGDEMGLQATDPVLCAATDPNTPERVESPGGMIFDPYADTFERPASCNPNEDLDDDGIVNEIDPAVVDHLEFYLLNYFRPGQGEMTDDAEDGEELMYDFKCTACHIQDLTIEYDRRIADVDTRYDRERGIFNRLFATAETLFEVIEDGYEYPMLLPEGKSFKVENIWTDFKRHDLGPMFHERMYDGSLHKEFMTEPLWGVGSTSPYGHDGRSINLREVILRHGGEAEDSKKRFADASRSEQDELIDYLNTLILFPPDDTASNLNPGRRNSDNPQDPSNHGNIALPALFQIDLGVE